MCAPQASTIASEALLTTSDVKLSEDKYSVPPDSLNIDIPEATPDRLASARELQQRQPEVRSCFFSATRCNECQKWAC